MKNVDDRPKHVVIVASRDESGDARLAVRDSGVGVAADCASKLFEPHDGPGATFAFSIPVTGKREPQAASASEPVRGEP